MPSLGPMELILILVIVVLLFGSTRLPQIGKGLGEGIRNFKKGFKGEDEEAPRRTDRIEDKTDPR